MPVKKNKNKKLNFFPIREKGKTEQNIYSQNIFCNVLRLHLIIELLNLICGVTIPILILRSAAFDVQFEENVFKNLHRNIIKHQDLSYLVLFYFDLKYSFICKIILSAIFSGYSFKHNLLFVHSI